MKRHESSYVVSQLVERVLSAPGTISLLHAPAGYGKSWLLQGIRARLDALQLSYVETLKGIRSGPTCPWILLDEDRLQGLDLSVLRPLLDRAAASRAGIVIAARAIEHLPLARLRIEGRVLDFGPRQMGLSRRESEARLRTALPREAADRLAGLADGWPIAVQTLLGHAHAVNARFDEEGDFLVFSGLSAYIDQEILSGLPDPWGEALRYASIVEGCDRAMLDFIRPDDDLGRHLSALRARLPGLIEDRDGQTVINPLLQRHLARQFEQLPRPMRMDALERAAQRCAQTGRAAEAVSLVARVGTAAAITEFVRQSDGLKIWLTAGFDAIREIVGKAGSLGVEGDPRIRMFRCVVLLKTGEIDEAERIFNEIGSLLPDDEAFQRDVEIMRMALTIYGCRALREGEMDNFGLGLLRNKDDPAVKTLVTTMRCVLTIQHGDLDKAIAEIIEATKQTRAAAGGYNLPFLDIHRANIALARGELQSARVDLGKARKAWREEFPEDAGLQTVLDALTASLEFEAGRLSSARIHIRRSTQNMPHVDAWLDIYVAAYEPMARLMTLDIGLPATIASLDAQQAALRIAGLPRVARIVKALELCLRGEAGLRGAGGIAIERIKSEKHDGSSSWQERELFAMAEAYAHLAVGHHGPAGNALAALIRFAEPRGLQRTVLRASLLLVAVLDSRGDPRGADGMFEHALALGARTGMSRVFAEIGGLAVHTRVAAVVASLRDAAPADPGRLRLLRQLARWQDAVPSQTVVRLTPRESDVLSALDQGGADKMVGRRLGITEHAVRYHLKNIYRKLGVNDRVGALFQARETGLLG